MDVINWNGRDVIEKWGLKKSCTGLWGTTRPLALKKKHIKGWGKHTKLKARLKVRLKVQRDGIIFGAR